MVESDDRISSSHKGKDGDDPQLGSRDGDFALKYYEIMLGALSSRERQVIQMFAYVAPAMVAMAWLVTTDNDLLLFGGSCVLAVILAHGRQHIVRMAYNFRSCMLQTGTIEKKMGWKRYILVKWTRRTKTPPDDFLPEMFKSQVRILQIAMWSVIVIGAVAILGPTGRNLYSCFFEKASWPKSDCYQIEHILPALALVVFMILGVWMESLCSATFDKAVRGLSEMYDLEKPEEDSQAPSKVPGDIDNVAQSGRLP